MVLLLLDSLAVDLLLLRFFCWWLRVCVSIDVGVVVYCDVMRREVLLCVVYLMLPRCVLL